MGIISNRGRLQTRICSKASSIRDKRNFSPKEKFRYIKCRSGRIIKKRCYRTRSHERERTRFLQHLFPSSKKEWKNETSDKSETPEQVSEKRTFQNGHHDKSSESSEAKRLGNLSGLKRSLLACSNISEPQKVSTILHSRPLLSVEMPLLRTHDSPKGLYKSNVSRDSTFKNPEYQTGFIPRRLVGCQSDSASSASRSREMSQSSDFTRLHSKQREIRSSSQTGNSIHRGHFSFCTENSDSNSRKNKKVSFCCEELMQGPKSGKRFPSFVGDHGIMPRIDTKCTSFHETHSVASPGILEPCLYGSRGFHSSYTTSKVSSAMVVKSSKHHEGQIFTTETHPTNHYYRCFQTGIWGSCRQSLHSRDMVRIPAETTHQSFGVGSGIPHYKAFPSNSKEQDCSSKKRLNHCSAVYHKTGGHEISSSMLQDLGSMELCHTKQHTHQGSPHFGLSEHSRRSVIESQNTTHRMDASQIGGSKDFPFVGISFDRPVCISKEQTDSDILFMDSASRCSGSGCSVNLMGKHVCICLSSHLSNPKSPETYGAVSLPGDSDSSKMASQTLVHRSTTNVNSLSKEAATLAKPVTTTKFNDTSSQPRSIQSTCLASIDRSFQEKGFSSKSRKLLSASWRQGTQRDYTGKFNKFNSWCHERQIDPYSTSLTQVADFLTDLFESGLQYRTIAGYRSMLSAVLQPIGNIPVGQHPHIIRLLKGVFNSRPPTVKLLPEWDLQLVLNMLQKEPFEPLSKASLKITTFKTIFLMAISTFRRCGDLQSLKLGEGSVRVQKKGVTFIRQGLAKQDRERHFGSQIFVPAFQENYRLDPKRALYWYLKKTQFLRKGSDGISEKKIFLALNKPHQAVSTQTISNWIVQTIKMAYQDKCLKVKAHSTRALGPTWALYKGASMKSILEVADWSKKSTFTKFYLRDLDVKVLKQ